MKKGNQMAKIKSYDLMTEDGLVVGNFDNFDQAKDSLHLHIKLDEQNGIPAEDKYYIKLIME